MFSVEDLKADTYYLIQLQETSPIQLVSVLFQSREAVLLRSYIPFNEDFFKSKSDIIYKLVEEFDDETAATFESVYHEQEEEEEELFEFEEDEEE